MSDDMDMSGINFGRIAFEAYKVARQGLTHDKQQIPAWDHVGADVQSAWEAAAKAVIGFVGWSYLAHAEAQRERSAKTAELIAGVQQRLVAHDHEVQQLTADLRKALDDHYDALIAAQIARVMQVSEQAGPPKGLFSKETPEEKDTGL